MEGYTDTQEGPSHPHLTLSLGYNKNLTMPNLSFTAVPYYTGLLYKSLLSSQRK